MVKVANVEGLVARKTGKNSRTWYFRLAVPTRDQKRAGCKDIWISLRTENKAEALRALPAAMTLAEAKLSARLNAATPGAHDVNAASIAGGPAGDIARLSIKLAEAHYQLVKERDCIERAELYEKAFADQAAFFRGQFVGLPDTPYMDLLREDGEIPLSDVLTYYWWHRYEQREIKLRGALSAGDVWQALEHLDQHLARLGETISKREQRLLLARAVIRAEIDALIDIRKDNEGRYQALVSKMAADPAALGSDLCPNAGPSLSIAATDWISEKSSSSWSPRRRDACKATLALFLEIVGDRPIASYSKGDDGGRVAKSVACADGASLGATAESDRCQKPPEAATVVLRSSLEKC